MLFSMFHHYLQPSRIERVEAVEGFFCVLDGEVTERAVLVLHEDFGFLLQFRCAFLKEVDEFVDVHRLIV